MPRQLDLLEDPGLIIEPEEGRSEPRFWVRRLVIWSNPKAILREITLRPGLNIIWSPDPADPASPNKDDNSLGHGSGKTLLCRLLRYVLGEAHPTDHDQREQITFAFPTGLVGAEIMVDGTQWAVLRPLGIKSQHFAVPNADLEQLAAGNFPSTGLEPLLEAIKENLLSERVAALISGHKPLQAWLVALAWLTRDQECRFDKLLDWRSPDSDSGSPVRNFSITERQDALRALIGAIQPEEFELRATITELETKRSNRSQESSRRLRHRNSDGNGLASLMAGRFR